jgi:hypothetical protein
MKWLSRASLMTRLENCYSDSYRKIFLQSRNLQILEGGNFEVKHIKEIAPL